METTTEVQPSKGLFRDFGHYALWWMIWMGLFTATQFVSSYADQRAFWMTKLTQLGLGLVYGLLCAVVFTIGQNTLNAARRKPVSWILAIVVAVAGNFIVTVATGRFT